MTLVAKHDDGEIHACDWRALAEHVASGGGCDALIVDAPYSERTHAGHDSGVDRSGRDIYNGRASKRTAACGRMPLSYSNWRVEEVRDFVAGWAPHVRGWIVSLTDHVLAPAWEETLESVGRYVFAPIACVDPGSRIRLAGDGPSNWAVWLIAARPRTREFQRWGTLPGAYIVGEGDRVPRDQRHATSVVGGKPPGLMRAIVRDYSRPGDLVVDPCGGAGTTALAARLEGRRFITGDLDASHVEIMRERLAPLPTHPKRGTLALFGGGERT